MELEIGFDENSPTMFVRVNKEMIRPKRPKNHSAASIKCYIKEAFGNALGYYPSMQAAATRQLGKIQMTEEIDWITAKGKEYKSAELLSKAADLLRSSSIWYFRPSLGDDPGEPIRKAILLIEEAIAIDPASAKYQIQLARILSGGSRTRDLGRARAILGELMARPNRDLIKSDRDLVKSQLKLIDRLEGVYTIDSNYSYEKASHLSPAHLTSERQTCRAIIRQHKKQKDFESMRPVLEHLYRIAILYEAYCALPSGPVALIIREHLRKNARKVRQLTYEKNGPIKPYSEKYRDGLFLTRNDYLAFELIHGVRTNYFDPTILLNEANNAAIGVA